MTVLEGIQKSAEFLEKKGVDSPRLQAELLLAHLLGMPRMKLYLNFDRALTPAETETFRELIKRRGQREPLQHITGSVSFCGYEITVNRHVLVPRPETELLAEAGWEFLKGAGPEIGAPKALDFGTGSGCIAIALAAKCAEARVLALDASSEALKVACENARSNQVEERIEFLSGTGLAALPGARTFDLIISNPPYIPAAEIESLEPEVRDYDPRAALDGGPDGLSFFRELAAGGRAILNSRGKVMVEFGDGQAEAVKEIFEKQNWIVEAVREDYTRRSRVLIAGRK